MLNSLQKKAIREFLSSKIACRKDFDKAKRVVAKKFGIAVLTNSEILKYLSLNKSVKVDEKLSAMLKKRAVRTMSGIAPVAVLTKPWPCPGKCAFCPAEKDVPQSYLSNEPAVMRAIRCGYDPYAQVQDRLRALIANGHNPEKIELIVIGGTWSCLPEKYKYWYIASCFAGANQFKRQKAKGKKQKCSLKMELPALKANLLNEQEKNEKAKYRVIGLTLETRPDYIDEKELWQMRQLGCTRVELGVQQIDDEVLKLNRRGHGVKEIVEATAMLRRFGFKITYHLMPGLPGSNLSKDFKMFKTLFSDERFQPDQIKFYPTVVTRGSLLYRWWKQGRYKPYSDKALRDLIIKCKKTIPEYVRVIRLIRDIPCESIEAGNRVTNLRQVIKDQGAECRCIRCREVGSHATCSMQHITQIKYEVSGGREYFIQAVTKDGKLLGFCRLFLSDRVMKNEERVTDSEKTVVDNFFADAAMIRELHVYGELTGVGKRGKVQHSGLGRKLLFYAEGLAQENGFGKMMVISGVGVRGYYRKAGYRLKDSYLYKDLNLQL